MGDHQKPGVGAAGHFVQQVAKPGDIGVIQRCVHLVKHADRRGVGQKYRENQGHSGECLFAARQQRQHRQLFTRWLAHDFQPRIQRIVAFHQHQPGLSAAKKMGEQQGEIVVHLLECGQKPLSPLAIQRSDATAQGPDRLLQIGLFAHQCVMFKLHRNRVLLGPKVNSPQRITLAAQRGNLCLDGVRSGHIGGIGGQTCQQILRCDRQRLGNPGRGGNHQIGGGIAAGLCPGAGLARLRRQPLCLAFGQTCGPRPGFGQTQPLGGCAAAGFGLLHRNCQRGPLCRNRHRHRLRPGQLGF